MKKIYTRGLSIVLAILLTVTAMFGTGLYDVKADELVSLAAWSYDAAPANGLPANATSGSGTLSIAGASYVGYSSKALSANSWTVGGGWVIAVDGSEAANLKFNASLRASSTGPGQFRLEYSLNNGTDWTAVTGSEVSVTSTLSPKYTDFALPSALDGKSFQLKVTAWSPVTSGGATVTAFGGSGSSQINGISITGSKTAATAPVETCSAVTATPDTGKITAGATVSLTSATAGAQIYYNTNDTANYSLYTGPVAVSASVNIHAYASKTGFNDSAVSTFSYTVDPVAPNPVTPTVKTGTLLSTLSVGDEVMIYFKASNVVLGSEVSGAKLKGVSATADAGSLAVPSGAALMTVSMDENGYYSFVSNGKYLTSTPTGSGLSFADAASDYSLWIVEQGTSGYHLKNVNAKYGTSNQCVEYYNGFTTYSYNAAKESIYSFDFYKTGTGTIPTSYDKSVINQIAQWAGNADYSALGGNQIQGDLYGTNDMKDAASLFTAVVSGNKVKPYTSATSGGGTSYYMGGTGLGSGTNDYLELKLSSRGYGNMKLGFRLRSSNTGSGSYTMMYSTDGTTFTAFTSGTYSYSYTSYPSGVATPVSDSGVITDGVARTSLAPGNYVSFTFDVPEAASNAQQLYIRMVAGKEAAKSGTTINTAGTVRMDSVTMKGNPVISSAICGYVAVTPDSGEVALGSSISLASATKNAVIHYSTDGVNYSIYNPDAKPVISNLPMVISVYATKTGVADSIRTIHSFTQAQCSVVKATPNGGALPMNGRVILKDSTDGAAILYAYSDGTTADADLVWKTYDAPIVLTSFPVEIKTKAVKTGYLDSSVSSLSFTEKTNEKYNIYFGQLHAHTNYSDGTGTVADAFSHASKVSNLDFLAITDHSNMLDNENISNINKNVDTSATNEWTMGHKLAKDYSTDKFTCMYGYEMTWSNGLGHMNTFNTEGFQSRTQTPYATYSTALQNYYATLQTAPDSISQFNHPGTTFGDFSDFAYYSEASDNLITMIEVGNGEGTVGSSGYFPSYEYYTRALDKGWHVAPTNNQDNHKGLWGDANTARSVVLADSNTESSIYDAMRNYRVYATEDNNLSIYYTLNSYVMGSILSTDQVGSQLDLQVDLSDADSTDNIGKVEVIVNGGLSVASKTVLTNKQTVNFEIPANYSYYYIKVTEADGDIAVTAPVWVGSVESCGINKTYTNAKVAVQNEAVDVNLELYNNEKTDLSLTSIDFSVDGTSVKNLNADELAALGLTKVTSNGVAKYSFNYLSDLAGKRTINVTVKGMLNGVEKVYKDTLTITFVMPSMVTHVIVDGTHYNDYVAGYYGGNMSSFRTICGNSNIQVNIETKEITPAELADCELLIISAPAKKTATATTGNYVPSHFSDTFIQMVADYVKKGGSVILCGTADYQDTASGSTSTEMNKLLVAMGSTMRFHSDEAYDTTNNGGQAYRLYLNNFDRNDPYMANLSATQKFSLYSGCSIDMSSATGNSLVNDAVSLVNGYSTTYSIDSRDDNGVATATPNPVVAAAGTLTALARQSTKAGGNIFAAGSVFMSDFEVKADIDNSTSEQYANYTIINNILATIEKKIPVSTIADARKGAEGDIFAVEGYVTSGTTNPGTTFFDTIYIQDATGGIDIFPVSETGIAIGTKVRVTGYTSQYQGDIELRVIRYEILKDAPSIIPATVLSTKDAMNYALHGGSLVQTSGTVTRVNYTMDGKGLAECWIKDASGVEAAVFVDGYIYSGTTGKNELASLVRPGVQITATGILYMHPEGDAVGSVPVLRVRDCDNVQLSSDAGKDEPSTEPTTDPVIIEPATTKPATTDPASPTTPTVPVTPSSAASETTKGEVAGDSETTSGEVEADHSETTTSGAKEVNTYAHDGMNMILALALVSGCLVGVTALWQLNSHKNKNRKKRA